MGERVLVNNMGIGELTFLEEGRFTQRDERVRDIVAQLKDSGGSPWGAISKHVATIRSDDSNKIAEYRKRTGSEILEPSGHITGCTDRALAFIVLAREWGIPTAFVETYAKEWLENPVGCIQGHIYTDLQIGENWKAYDPITGFVKGARTGKGRTYVEVARGVDPGELYVAGREKSISILTFGDMVKFAKELKEEGSK